MKTSTFLLFCVASTFSSFSHAYTDAEMIRSLEDAARSMNAKLPAGTPASMVIMVRAGPGKRMTYESVVPTPAREWTQAMLAHSKRIAVNGYCIGPDYAFWREMNVTVVYRTSDQEGVPVYTHTVSNRDCLR